MCQDSLVHLNPCFIHGRNVCPVRNAQLVRFGARVGFVIVPMLVGEKLDTPTG